MKTKPPASPAKILVIDDNPIIRRTVHFALRDKGCKVLMSGDVTDALAVVRKEKPDLILLDLNFPFDGSLHGQDRDGFWTIGWLARMEEAKNVPVIVISSDEAAKSESRALTAGAAAYFQKPINHEALAAKIAEVLSKKPDPGQPASASK